jgi:GT2 family glycosyltransferase
MKSFKPSTSVVIVTKDRAKDLSECLISLAQQSIYPEELVVVDNNSSDQTAKVVADFSKTVQFAVRRVLEKGKGYPKIYNRGIKESKSDWVIFIDDDCVADKDWLKNFKRAIKSHPNLATAIGFSGTYYPHNPYALTTFFFNYLWKENGAKGNDVLDLEILDNKNIAYNKKFLKAHHIQYDQARIREYNGASEDCDLGRQIGEAGGKALYDKSIRVYHKDPRTFSHYFKKTAVALKAYQTYRSKWQLSMADGFKRVRVRSFLPFFIQEQRLNPYEAFIVTCLVFTTILLKKYLIFRWNWS